MTYVFDTSPFSALFRNFYVARFPTLWKYFDKLINDGSITSTREVKREILNGPVERLRDWVENNKEVFSTPTAEEGKYVSNIFDVSHFRQNIERQKFLKGGDVADPFVVVKAWAIGGTVVTIEKSRPNTNGHKE